jgi:hypothetical protein
MSLQRVRSIQVHGSDATSRSTALPAPANPCLLAPTGSVFRGLARGYICSRIAMAHISAAAGPSAGSLLFEIISASDLPAVDEGSADAYVVITGSDGFVLSGFDMFFFSKE